MSSSSSSLEQISNDLKVSRLVISKLGETFNTFQLHSSSILCLSEQWRNLETNFSAIDSLLVNRVKELEVKERDNGDTLIRLQNVFNQVEIRQKMLDFGEKCVAERVSGVEIREKDLKECYEGMEIEKEEIDDRRKAVLLLEKRLEEREKEIERRCEAVELEEVRVRELREGKIKEVGAKGNEIEEGEIRVKEEMDEVYEALELREKEMDEKLKLLEGREKLVNDGKIEVELRDEEVKRRCEALELKEEGFKRRCEALELKEEGFKRRCRALEFKEKGLNELSKVLETKEKGLNERCKELEAKEREIGVGWGRVKIKEKEVTKACDNVILKEKRLKEWSEAIEFKEKNVNGRQRVLEAKEREIGVSWGRVKSKEKEVNVACERVGLKEKQLNEWSAAIEFKEKEVNERQRVLELEEEKMKKGFQVLELKEKQMCDSYKAMEVKEREAEEFCQAERVKLKKIILVVRALKLKEDEILKRCQGMLSSKGLELKEKIGEGKKAMELNESCQAGNMKVKQTDECAKAVELKKIEILKRYRGMETNKGLKLNAKQIDESHKAMESKEREVHEGCQAGKVKPVDECVKALELEEDDSGKELELKEKVALEVLKKNRNDVASEVMEVKQKEGKSTSSMKVTSVIHLLCINMDACGVISHLINNVERQNMLKEKILDALSCAPDPAKLVFNVCRSFDLTNSDQVHGDAKISCIFLLEQFANLSPSISTTVKDGARHLAVIWKSRKKGPADALIFLLFIAAYDLASVFNTHELFFHFSLILNTDYCLEKTVYLRCALGLEEHIPGHVISLIKQQKWLMAVKYVCTFKLESSFPPAYLIEAYLMTSKKRVEEKLSEGTLKAENIAIDMESSFLRDVVRCISNFKLESEFPPKALQSRLEQLKDMRTASNSALLGKRVASYSTSVEHVKHQGKRPRVGTLYDE